VAAASLAVALYNGPEFPVRCRAGVFVAFHGSWNRAPFPQGGYNVVFPSLPRPRRQSLRGCSPTASRARWPISPRAGLGGGRIRPIAPLGGPM